MKHVLLFSEDDLQAIVAEYVNSKKKFDKEVTPDQVSFQLKPNGDYPDSGYFFSGAEIVLDNGA